MAIYSHSKLSTFQACKYQYKLKYVDRIKVDIPTTIEMFMGSCVHKALEKLYKDLKYKKLNSKEDILNFYKEEWGKQWSDDILIVKDYPKENYKIMGEEFLVNYYDEYAPFNQFTIIGLETEERLRLSDGSFYHVRIDRLASIAGTYYVCDYKTNSKMKSQVEADSDRQLAMYSLWVKNYFKDAQRVVLLWHMLAFNKEISSERTNLQLKELEGEVVSLIKEIESTKEYPTSVTSLCDYCVYKNLCPSFSHEVKLEQKSLRDYQKDDGLRLVNVFSELKEKESAVEGELKKVKLELINFAKSEKIDVVFGSNKKVSVKEFARVSIPDENKERVEALLKKEGLFEEFSQVSWQKVASNISEGRLKEVAKLSKKETDFRVSLSKKKESVEE